MKIRRNKIESKPRETIEVYAKPNKNKTENGNPSEDNICYLPRTFASYNYNYLICLRYNWQGHGTNQPFIERENEQKNS